MRSQSDTVIMKILAVAILGLSQHFRGSTFSIINGAS